MTRCVVTFHAHFAALCTRRELAGAGVKSTLAPVLRALSSSCGTCLKYASFIARLALMSRDLEQVVERAEGVCQQVASC
jgi:hypothetical protein